MQARHGTIWLVLGALCLLARHSPAAGGTKSSLQTATAWSIQGKRIIGCCCGTPCPCRLNKKPMLCHGCDATTAVHIESGSIRGVKMDGLTFVLTARAFGEAPSGNWLHLYVDARATPEQVKALEWLLTNGMPPISKQKAPHLLGKSLGMSKASIAWKVTNRGRDWSVSIPGLLSLRTRALYLPGHKKPAVSENILDDFGTQFLHADCLEHVYNDKKIRRSWNLTGRQCNQAPFALDAKRVAKGSIGWGCWSAHSDFGDKSKYQQQMGEHE